MLSLQRRQPFISKVNKKKKGEEEKEPKKKRKQTTTVNGIIAALPTAAACIKVGKQWLTDACPVSKFLAAQSR